MAQIIASFNTNLNSFRSDPRDFIASLRPSTKIGCRLGYAAGAGALVAVIGAPIGVASGAIFGATSWLVGRSVTWISDKVLDATNLSENTLAKTTARALKIFLTIGAGACLLPILTPLEFPIISSFAVATILNVATGIVPLSIMILGLMSTNFITSQNNHTIRTVYKLIHAAGKGALTSIMIGSSLGAAGGAIFGATPWVTYRTLSWVNDKVLDATDLSKNRFAKITAFMLKFLMITGVCMWTATLAGFPVTFATAIILRLVIPNMLPAIISAALFSMFLGAPSDHIFCSEVQRATQSRINQIFSDCGDQVINAGARLINNDVLANVSSKTLELFAAMHPSIFPFISIKAVFIYSLGPRRNKKILPYFKETTQDSIRVLRQELNDEATINQVRPFITDLVPSEDEASKAPEVRALIQRLRAIGWKEIEGSFLTTECYERALELVPR